MILKVISPGDWVKSLCWKQVCQFLKQHLTFSSPGDWVKSLCWKLFSTPMLVFNWKVPATGLSRFVGNLIFFLIKDFYFLSRRLG